MSVLNQPQLPEVDPAVRAANMLKNQTRQTFQQMVIAFNQGANRFWKNSKATPTEIAAALGADAKEIFELHAKLGALIGSVKPEDIAEGISAVGQFTMNEDGTVTVITVTTPAP
jgi:hypothetical protein